MAARRPPRARIAVLLPELGRSVLPALGASALPDRLLLGLRVPLIAAMIAAFINQLPGHGQIAGSAELPVEELEQPLDSTRPVSAADRADSVASRSSRSKKPG